MPASRDKGAPNRPYEVKQTVKRAVTKKATLVNHRTIVGRLRRKKMEARILEAALHVFAEKGPEAAVIDDFIKAAGIARGTFYNYFRSTGELLEATKTWLSDELILSIEEATADVQDPAIRLGMGIRLWIRRAEADRVWCAFMAGVRMSSKAQLAPIRDIKRAMKLNTLNIPSVEAALDLMEGTAIAAMVRMMNKSPGKNYCQSIPGIILQGMGMDRKTIATIMALPLPEFRQPSRKIE